MIRVLERLYPNQRSTLQVTAMQCYTGYSDLKKRDHATYKLIVRLGNSGTYVGGDMRQGNWFIANNPYFVTEAQWRTIALRMLSYDNLKGKTLPQVIERFYYEQRTIKIGDETLYLPSGSILGYMQGMFMRIDAEGNINT